MLGPVVAAFILALIRSDLFFLGVDPNYSTVIQGVIMVVVVMIGGGRGPAAEAGMTQRRRRGRGIPAVVATVDRHGGAASGSSRSSRC